MIDSNLFFMHLTNPLPPQAYTKEILLKAYGWLQTQNPQVREMATHPDLLVSLYLKAQSDGEEVLSRPCIVNFKNGLKGLIESEPQQLISSLPQPSHQQPSPQRLPPQRQTHRSRLQQRPQRQSSSASSSSQVGVQKQQMEFDLDSELRSWHSHPSSSSPPISPSLPSALQPPSPAFSTDLKQEGSKGLSGSSISASVDSSGAVKPGEAVGGLAPGVPISSSAGSSVNPVGPSLGSSAGSSPPVVPVRSQSSTQGPPPPNSSSARLETHSTHPLPSTSLQASTLVFDARSWSMIQEILEVYNLSSEMEVLRLMISIAYKKLKAI